MLDYFGSKLIDEKRYVTQNKKFTYEQSIYALEDLIRRSGNGSVRDLTKTCFNLVYEFISGENDDTEAVFDMRKFENFLYSTSVNYVYGGNLEGVILEEELYSPPYEIEKIVQKKRKKETPLAKDESGNAEIAELKAQIAEMSAGMSALMKGLEDANKPTTEQPKKPAGKPKPANTGEQGGVGQPANQWGNTGVDHDNRAAKQG